MWAGKRAKKVFKFEKRKTLMKQKRNIEAVNILFEGLRCRKTKSCDNGEDGWFLYNCEGLLTAQPML